MLGVYGEKGAASRTEWDKFSLVSEWVEVSARHSIGQDEGLKVWNSNVDP